MGMKSGIFGIGVKQIFRDGMLAVLLIAPFMIGALFKYGVPFADGILFTHTGYKLQSWYALFDAVLLAISPCLVAIACAFVMLEERDEGISAYYKITPAGKYYLASRIGIAMCWGFFSSLLATALFHLTAFDFRAVLGAVVGVLNGMCSALLIVALAGNKVEGLAMAKLISLSFMGLAAYWFLPGNLRWMGAFLPSYWLGAAMQSGASFLGGLIVCGVWIVVLYKKYARRME